MYATYLIEDLLSFEPYRAQLDSFGSLESFELLLSGVDVVPLVELLAEFYDLGHFRPPQIQKAFQYLLMAGGVAQRVVIKQPQQSLNHVLIAEEG